MEDKKKSMYELKLNEVMKIRNDYWIRRVPGGWIYEYEGNRCTTAAVFVPYALPDKLER